MINFMKKCLVFYESWQMDCCGTAFSIGDTIKWLVCKAELQYISIDIGKMDYDYEAHSSEWKSLFVLEGKVEEIKILYQKYEPSENDSRFLVPVSGELVEIETAKGFDKNWNDMQASGYIVSLNECIIKPAKKKEVTFR